MFKLKKYKGIKDLQEFMDNGLLIIHSNGDKHRFKTVGNLHVLQLYK